ncbi:sulfatase [Membranihabitans marinus]|uniref:sulfatase n=1 Tax=Membranihabitans marinus TaxID=1227546 RepID=UPI001F492228|nr:sulfatase [Membranihabitans marinus]
MNKIGGIIIGVLIIGIHFVSAQSVPKKNILLICIDDLRPELKSFGADYIHSPNIDALANRGRAFRSHYVNSPSCGPSRYTLLTGLYGPPGNNALFQRAEKLKSNPQDVKPSMPEWFRTNGYTTVSVGKVSHHPGGRGGDDWDDDTVIEMPNAWDRHLMPVGEWQHPRGSMHGLAHGEIREGRGTMDVYQSVEGEANIYPDGLIVETALEELEALASDKEQPFFLAVGIIKPHLPFGAPKKYYDMYKDVELPVVPHPEKPEGLSTWHGSGEFNQYNRWGKDAREDAEFALEVRRHYAACVSFADAQVGRIMAKLKETGADKNTIVIVWGDHGWNLGEHGIWGKHNLYNEALHSPLIIDYPNMKKRGKNSRAIVETVDIFPTLCDLAEVKKPDFVVGQSLMPQIKKPKRSGHPALAYNNKATTVRTDEYRMIWHKDGGVELYNEIQDPYEVKNIALENQAVVEALKRIVKEKGK